jgi:ATP synthase F1 epsilon subunit
MALAIHGTFQCVVVAPQGKLIDCNATSVIFPAYDGHVGVMKNHMPMLCKLGLGIMEIKYVVPHEEWESTTFVFIDQGFAMVAANVLAVTASEAIWFKDMPPERLKHMLEKAQRQFSAGVYTPEQRAYQAKKLAFLHRLAELSEIPAQKTISV